MADGTPNAAEFLTHGAHGTFGVRRLVAAFSSLVLPHTGSLLPGLPQCACSQAWVSAENSSKLPFPGQNTISRAATSRRTPNAPCSRRMELRFPFCRHDRFQGTGACEQAAPVLGTQRRDVAGESERHPVQPGVRGRQERGYIFR